MRPEFLSVPDFFSLVKSNQKFRKYVYTDLNVQVVCMKLGAGREIPLESHPTTQLFVVIKGSVVVIVRGKNGDRATEISAGGMVVIPAGRKHYVIAIKDTHLFTTYSPKEHEIPRDEN